MINKIKDFFKYRVYIDDEIWMIGPITFYPLAKNWEIWYCSYLNRFYIGFWIMGISIDFPRNFYSFDKEFPKKLK